jgi:hypothetical protein
VVNPLTVTGTLRCGGPPINAVKANWCADNACILNLGIQDLDPSPPGLPALCSTVFQPLGGLGAGEVLLYSQTVAGLNCNLSSEVIAFTTAETRYCTGQTSNNDPVDCIVDDPEPFTASNANGQNGLNVDVKFHQKVLNVGCGPNSNNTWNFTITANQHVPDITQIVPSSLAVEGLGPVTCDAVNTTVVPNTRTCQIKSCQPNPVELATLICNSNPDGTADLRVTGTLNTGTPIYGEDVNHPWKGKCQPL